MRATVTAFGCLAFALAGCFYDVDRSKIDAGSGETDTGTDTGTVADDGGVDAGETGIVLGTVSIADGLDAASYAVADLYITILDACPTMTNTPVTLAVHCEQDADLSEPGKTHGFALNDAPVGHVFVFVFLDSDMDADAENPVPDAGDAVAVDGMAPVCAEIDVVADQATDGVDITLNTTMPNV